MTEAEELNLRGVIEALGTLGDVHSSTNLALLAQDPKRSELVRAAAARCPG